MDTKRNYGIDLLRLVLMFMVCLLHILGQGGILSASEGTMKYKVYWLLEVCAFCAVDGFALITGYTASDRPQKWHKIVTMWFQVFFYSFILTVLLQILGMSEPMSLKEYCKLLMPVLFRTFWYFSAYVLLFFAMPLLNKFLFSIEKSTAQKVFILLILFFSFTGMVGDPFQLEGGYSALWLIVLYCLGVLAKRIRVFETKKSVTLLLLLVSSCLISWFISIFIDKNLNRLVSYTSPTILLNGLLLVVLFSRIRIKGTLLVKISPLAFGIYLFQLNPIIWEKLSNRMMPVAEKSIALGATEVCLMAFLLFVIGLAVEWIRSQISKMLHLQTLSQKIVDLGTWLLEKGIEVFH